MNNIPYKEPFPSEDDLMFNTISAQECTGLIPAKASEENEIEAYEEIYPYLTPKIDRDIAKK